MRDHRDIAGAGCQSSGDMECRCAGSQHQNFVWQDEIGDDGGHCLPLGDHDRLAVGEGRLEREGAGCSAIGAVDELLFLKLHQIPPDRFAGDTERGCQFRGPQGWGRRQLRDDVFVTRDFGETVAFQSPRLPVG